MVAKELPELKDIEGRLREYKIKEASQLGRKWNHHVRLCAKITQLAGHRVVVHVLYDTTRFLPCGQAVSQLQRWECKVTTKEEVENDEHGTGSETFAAVWEMYYVFRDAIRQAIVQLHVSADWNDPEDL